MTSNEKPASEKIEGRYKARVAVGLVHYPIRDRLKKIVATNITNFDIHDIARACQVYGIDSYYLIHPAEDQRSFVARVLDHWRTGEGASFNPMRRTALNSVKTAVSIEAALKDFNEPNPLLVATSARKEAHQTSYSFKELREQVWEQDRPLFLLFGTGFGLSEEVLVQCEGMLESIRGVPPQDYRHLSVRSAVSICLDRLFGSW